MPGMCAGLTRGPLPPFSDLFILKELRKRILDLHILKDMRAKAHTGRIVISLRFRARKKLRRGTMESDATFCRGSVKKNRSKVNKKNAGTGIPALRGVYGSLFGKR